MDMDAVPIQKNKKWRWISISIGALLSIGIAGYAIQTQLWRSGNVLTPVIAHNNLGIDLHHPDVLIDSYSLGQLPKDLLKIPLLSDILTEDFIFYYQNNGDRLGLEGSVRRIVYEHDLNLRDRLLNILLNEPAKVALWHDAKGRLSHFMVVIHRGGMARLLEPLALAITSDNQLTKTDLNGLKIGGVAIPVYQLRYNGKSLLFASHGDNLLLLSSSEMMFNKDKQEQLSVEVAQDLLAGKSPWETSYGLTSVSETEKEGVPQVKQRIAASANYLGFGYQRLFPAFAGVRFDMDDKGWHSFLALNDSDAARDSSFAFRPIWQAMPMGASLCAVVPYSRGIAEEILKQFSGINTANKALQGHFNGTAGICWYPDSRLHSPLVIGQLNNVNEEQRNALGNIFGHVIGAKENKAPDKILPVQFIHQDETWLWQREVSSRFGNHDADKSDDAQHLMSQKFFRVSLSLHGNTLLFSLDDNLVVKGIRTLSKAYPPMSDVLPENSLIPFYSSPDKLAHLLQNEVFDSLPQNIEPIFYNAAQTSLLPKIEALAKHKNYVLMLPEKTQADQPWQWIPINWQDL